MFSIIILFQIFQEHGHFQGTSYISLDDLTQFDNENNKLRRNNESFVDEIKTYSRKVSIYNERDQVLFQYSVL